MRKMVFAIASAMALQMVGIPTSHAAIKLTVQYTVPFAYGENVTGLDPYATCLVDSKCDTDAKKRATLFIKKSTTKALFTTGCKRQDTSYLGSRLKVTSATGATAGLGNLTSVVATNISWDVETANVEEWTSEEDYPYESEEDDPSYIEGGYEYVFFTADCLYSGSVSLVKSNAYTIFIDGSRGPEYSYTELAKKKWTVQLIDN
jgi:hypothetical protein